MGENMVPNAVGALHLGHTRAVGRLTLLPIRDKQGVKVRYVLLDEAVRRGRMTVTEVSEAGSVPYLLARNLGPWPVLVFDGEELVGAKQNRIANTTILVGVGKTVLPVSCVEQGRWSHRTRTFSPGEYACHPGLRFLKEKRVREASLAEAREYEARRVRSEGESARADRRSWEDRETQPSRAQRYRSHQGEVWDEVSRTVVSLGAEAPTMAMADSYQAARTDVDTLLRELAPEVVFETDDVAGVAVFFASKFVCLDLLRPAKRFLELYPKLLRGYAFEAVMREKQGVMPLEDTNGGSEFDAEAAVLNLFADLVAAATEEQPAVDLGVDLRLTGKSCVAAGLAWNDELIQLSVFPRN